MLGDIHKHQFLDIDDDGNGRGRIAYSGSFVQKTKAESINKGFILWELERGVGNFIEIPLLEIYLNIEATDNNYTLPEIGDGQTIRHISINHNNCTFECLEQIQTEIKQTFGDISMNVISKNPTPIINNISNDMLNVETHERFIREILREENDNSINEILKHHGEIMQHRNANKRTLYRLNYLHWSNIYCYGEDNFIDFTGFKQNLVMLNGKNKTGKSTVMDILILILFNKCTRGIKADIVNKTKTKGFVKVSFNVGNIEYIIKQTCFRSSKDPQHELYRIDNDGVTDIREKKMNDTYDYLHKKIGLGDYTNFINMVIAVQNRNSFVDMSSEKFSKLLTTLTNIDMLEGLEKNIREKQLRDINRDLKKYDDAIKQLDKIKKINDDDLIEYENVENNLDIELTKIKEEISNIEGKINQICIGYNDIPIPVDLDDQINTSDSNLKEYDIATLHKSALLYKIDMRPDYVNNQLYTIKQRVEKISNDEIKHIRLTEFPVYSSEEQERLLQKRDELNNKTWQPLSERTFRDVNILKYIKQHYKKEKLIPEEICKIDSIKELDFIHPDELLNSLPDFELIRDKIVMTKKSIATYNTNFNNMVYNKDCESCRSNECNIQKIFDINAANNKLTKLNNILNDENNLREKFDLSEKYRYYKLQNEIFKRNQNVKELNDAIENRKTEYDIASKELDEYENKVNWDLLQIYEAHIKSFQDAEIKVLLEKMELLTKLQKYFDVKKENDKLHNWQNIKIANGDKKRIIAKLKERIRLKEQALKRIQNELSDTKNKHFIDARHVEDRNNLIIASKPLRDKQKFLSMYVKVIDCKTGIPKYVLEPICQKLQDSCNVILKEITDFTIKLKFDITTGQVSIYTVSNNNDISATTGSGMQKFILDLVFRISLLETTSVSNPRILFIDEGFGCLDEDNFRFVSEILQKIKTRFNAIIIISHIGKLLHYSDVSIHIKQINKMSKLVYGELPHEIKTSSVLTESKNDNKSIEEDNTINQYIEDNGGVMKLLYKRDTDDKLYCLCCKYQFTSNDDRKAMKHNNTDGHIKKQKSYIKKKMAEKN
jgi:DNA repair exonuclease SbcCD ATPase subunit